MTRVLTIRIPPDLLSRAEAKAAHLGLDRAKYVRSLIEDDLAAKGPKPKHKFVSEDLIGCYTRHLKGRAALKAFLAWAHDGVREVMRQRNLAKRERNR